MIIKDTQKHSLGYWLELSTTGQTTLAHVTQNGDLKERKYTREIYIWVYLSAMLILTLALP